MMCAHCGQPVDLAAGALFDNQRFYHGSCYRLEFPPEHPEEWPKPIALTPHEDDEWADHHGR